MRHVCSTESRGKALDFGAAESNGIGRVGSTKRRGKGVDPAPVDEVEHDREAKLSVGDQETVSPLP
eukprot:2911392-Rhodomonas_salina.2